MIHPGTVTDFIGIVTFAASMSLIFLISKKRVSEAKD
jgi:hypothetical protein